MQLINQKSLSDLAGVSKASISAIVRGRLKGACVGKGRGLQIDLEHPETQAYIDEKRAAAATPPGHTNAIAPRNGGNGASSGDALLILPGLDVALEDLEDLTVKQVALRYGGLANFSGYVKALKDIAAYKKTEQDNLIKRGELVARDTTAATLFYLIDSAFQRIVGEMPGALAQQLVPLILSAGEESEKEAKQLITEAASKILKDCKAEVKKNLAKLDKAPDV